MIPESYLYAAARRAGIDRLWWEDAAQEMRIELWRGGCDELDGLARRTIQTTAIDFSRKLTHFDRRRKQPTADALTFSYLEAMDVPVANLFTASVRPTEELLDLEEGLKTLSRRVCTILLLRANGYKIREIAAVYGFDEARVSQITRYARERLGAN